MLRRLLPLLLLAAPAPLPASATAQAPVQSTVHGVLFFAPTCTHCHTVMRETLPPLQARWGDAFRLTVVDVSTPEGQRLYRATVAELGIPPERTGVPTLVVGDRVLVGSGEIPALLPGLLETGVAGGGVPWPPVPELQAVMAALDGAAASAPAGVTAWSAESVQGGMSLSGAAERFLRDPVANGAAVAVLLLLGRLLARGAARARQVGLPATLPDGVWVPALVAVGLGVAGYLSFVEATGSPAVCGPVGDCNAVQASPWARLFGVLPVGAVGLFGYAALGASWLAARRARLALRRRDAARLFWLLAFAGTAFSAWLTFLEPFVIGATCAWCVTSALVMGGLLAAATAGKPLPVRRA